MFLGYLPHKTAVGSVHRWRHRSSECPADKAYLLRGHCYTPQSRPWGNGPYRLHLRAALSEWVGKSQC